MTNLVDFLGRFHPVVLHLPIGIYALAFMLQYLRPKRISIDDRLLALVLFFGWVAAVISCLLGWMLSLSGEYGENDIAWHKWSAIAFVLVSGTLSVFHQLRSRFTWYNKVYHLSFVATILLITLTGHLGGDLTHGEDFLFSNLGPESVLQSTDTVSSVKISDTSSADIYSAVMAPIIRKKCENCHNANKTKGGFRMDQFELLMKGGKHGPAIIPGDPNESELIRRILLSDQDEKHMPPKGKLQLSEIEINLLHWWVQHGADDKLIIKNVTSDTLKKFLANSVNTKVQLPELPNIASVDSTTLATLNKLGFTIKPVAMASGFLEVSCINMKSFQEEKLDSLKSIASNILWIKIADQSASDTGLSVIALLKNVQRIDVRNTKATDRFTKDLLSLPSLEYLNLVGTAVTDAGLQQLVNIRSLKRVYCWGTKITEAGMNDFKAKRPDVILDNGLPLKLQKK